MADAQAPGAAASEAASMSAHLRAINARTAPELRQQTGGHAGVVDVLAEVAGQFKSAPAAPIPVAGADGSTAVSGGGGPEKQEESWLYLRALAVHGGSLIECIDAGIKLDAVGNVVKVRYTDHFAHFSHAALILCCKIFVEIHILSAICECIICNATYNIQISECLLTRLSPTSHSLPHSLADQCNNTHRLPVVQLHVYVIGGPTYLALESFQSLLLLLQPINGQLWLLIVLMKRNHLHREMQQWLMLLMHIPRLRLRKAYHPAQSLLQLIRSCCSAAS